jgi:hypothetical protein
MGGLGGRPVKDGAPCKIGRIYSSQNLQFSLILNVRKAVLFSQVSNFRNGARMVDPSHRHGDLLVS